MKLLLSGFLSLFSTGDVPLTEIVGADTICRSPGARVYVNRNQQKLWVAGPNSKYGFEPRLTRYLPTGNSSLYLEGELLFYDEWVVLLFTLQPDDRGLLKATLRIYGEDGEEGASLHLSCKQALPE